MRIPRIFRALIGTNNEKNERRRRRISSASRSDATICGIPREEFIAGWQAEYQSLLDLGVRRALPPTYVLLTARVPITMPVDPADSWFGGHPRLPPDIPWPNVGGVDARFLCQINCARLPKNIWGGVGPRRGWLAFFAPPEWPYAPTVLHFEGHCETRQGPSPANSDWFLPRTRDCPSVLKLPRWPIDIEAMTTIEPVTRRHEKGRAPGHPDPLAGELIDLRQPQFQPFDHRSLLILLDVLREEMELFRKGAAKLSARTSEDTPRGKANADFLRDFVRRQDRSFAAFESIEAAARAPSALDIRQAITDLQSIVTVTYVRLEDDEAPGDGAIFQQLEHSLLEDPKPTYWQRKYLQRLSDYAKHVYSSDPSQLPEASRKRFETEWAFEALHEGGAMGNIPVEHFYAAAGPDQPNEVLLELRTSRLQGWIWGDVHSLIIVIDRDDLRNGRFDRVEWEITN